MKTIKIIDLLNKIANGEEVPKKIKNNNNCMIYEFDSEYNMYMGGDTEEYYTNAIIIMGKVSLNTEVEIIEDTPKEIYFDEEDIKSEEEVMKKIINRKER